MSKLKSFPFIYQSLLWLLNRVGYFDWKFRRNFPRYQPTPRWKDRIALVLTSPDNNNIARVSRAGQVLADHQRMHNGLRIRLGSYYDYGNTLLLQQNEGVHEPQEEYVFQEVLKVTPPGSTMLELGSYWAFYSMWFCQQVPQAECFMVEPDPYKMNFGRQNFRFNQMEGTFIKGFISDQSNPSGSVPTLTVDEITRTQNIRHLSVLHADIQGYEYAMLQGAKNVLQQQQADFIFISTHSNQLHAQCRECLLTYDYEVIADADLDESYSWDGLLVAKSAQAPSLPPLTISKRSDASATTKPVGQ
ncbi:MAG: FkbM family methyltransferase [Tunicatimonas sp.]